ncbi:hypothetical protein D3C87_1672380 [compost metagenome]
MLEGLARHFDEGLERGNPPLIEHFGIEALDERRQQIGLKTVAKGQVDQVLGMSDGPGNRR